MSDQAPQKDPSVNPLASTEGRIGYDLIGILIGSGFVGWLIDWFCGTMPWVMLAMIVVGFGICIRRAWQVMAASDRAPLRKQP